MDEVISGECAECAEEVHPHIEFNDSRDDNAGEEDIKVATLNIAVNEMISSECAEDAAEVHPRIEFNDSGDDDSEHHCE